MPTCTESRPLLYSFVASIFIEVSAPDHLCAAPEQSAWHLRFILISARDLKHLHAQTRRGLSEGCEGSVPLRLLMASRALLRTAHVFDSDCSHQRRNAADAGLPTANERPPPQPGRCRTSKGATSNVWCVRRRYGKESGDKMNQEVSSRCTYGKISYEHEPDHHHECDYAERGNGHASLEDDILRASANTKNEALVTGCSSREEESVHARRPEARCDKVRCA